MYKSQDEGKYAEERGHGSIDQKGIKESLVTFACLDYQCFI